MEEPPVDKQLLAWEKSLKRFDFKTDLLIIPQSSEVFIDMAIRSDVIRDTVGLAESKGVLVTIPGIFEPAIVRSGSTPLF